MNYMNKRNNPSIDQGHALFSPSMKLADLLEANYKLIWILSRMEMPLGFGDVTVEEACEKQGVDVDTFLLLCDVYTFDEYRPSAERLHNANLKDIITYLHLSHKFYLENSLRKLSDSLERVIEPCAEQQKKVIWKFFADYQAELENHFKFEEEKVFPYANKTLEGIKPDNLMSISQFEENHSNIEEKIGDLKNIVMKYLPQASKNSLSYDVLIDIFALEQDLRKHTSIEDDILVPIVRRLEGNE